MENYDIFSFPFTYSATHSLIVPHKENYYVLGLRLPRVAVVLFAALISYLTFVMRFHVPTTTRQPRVPVNVNFFGRPCTLLFVSNQRPVVLPGLDWNRSLESSPYGHHKLIIRDIVK